MTCPTCKRSIKPTDENSEPRSRTLPFCSQRCRAADLGSWLNESYRISGAMADEDLDASLSSDEDASRN